MKKIIRILWREAENCYAGRTCSRKYLTEEDINIKDLELWSKTKLE